MNNCVVNVKRTFPVSREKLWSFLNDNPEWFPGVENVVMKDNIRSFSTPDGEFVEEFFVDTENTSYNYTFLKSPFPLIDYQARFQIHELGKGECEIEWSSTFLPDAVSRDEAEMLVAGEYNKALHHLHEMSLNF